MKKLAFILLAATFMFSCKKSESIEDPPLTSPGMMAKIAGTSINYGLPTVEKQASTTGNETVFITAFTTDGNSIEISFSKQGGITAGTYGVSNAAYIGISDGMSYYSTANNVNIKIVAIDGTRIIGSFSGTAEDATTGSTLTRSISEGKFYANF